MRRVAVDGRTAEVEAGASLFDVAERLGVRLPSSCQRHGYCHECAVEVRSGAEGLTPPTAFESFLRPPYRLACQAVVRRGAEPIDFAPLRRTPRILASADRREVELDPVVARQGDRVLYDGVAMDRCRGRLLGLAVDLGTTTVVLEVVDLETGASLATSSFESPQRFGGSDVMHRISYDGHHPRELQRAAATAISRHLAELGERLGFTRREVYEICVAGNSTMRDLLFRLDVQSIGQRPYRSQVEAEFRAGRRSTTSLVARARRLGLRANLETRAYGLPLIAGHVGADAAAALLATGLDRDADQVSMLVDVGTNTEVLVAGRGRLLAASCPAGPAFEGGLITCGMPGYEGAIESVRLAPDGTFECATIGHAPAAGICGSGLIDLLAELRRSGRMTERGSLARRARNFALEIAPGVTFSAADASHLGQAKAANYCGQYILLRAFGAAPEEVAHLYLAGGFANYVDVENAIAIGFLAPVPRDRIHKVGNAALEGARQVLVSRGRRARLEALVRDVEHVELETVPDFFEVFVEGCHFRPMPARLD
ncbi:MAG: ASKHA domain-containing protein [Gemmatimonadota bacterium]